MARIETDQTRFRRTMGHSLAIKRRRAGLTLHQLADVAGVGYTTIWSYENGQTNIPGYMLYKLSCIMDCTMDELAGVER